MQYHLRSTKKQELKELTKYGGAGAQEQQGPADDNVVDADFEVKDDK